MGTIVEKIRAVCKEKGVAVSKLERDLKYGNGYLNPKKAKKVDSDRLTEIAEYLGVSTDYLLGTEIKKTPADNDERSEIQELFSQAEPWLQDQVLALLRANAQRHEVQGADPKAK